MKTSDRFKNFPIHDKSEVYEFYGKIIEVGEDFLLTDKEHKDLMKVLYPKDNSKRFRK